MHDVWGILILTIATKDDVNFIQTIKTTFMNNFTIYKISQMNNFCMNNLNIFVSILDNSYTFRNCRLSLCLHQTFGDINHITHDKLIKFRIYS